MRQKNAQSRRRGRGKRLGTRWRGGVVDEGVALEQGVAAGGVYGRNLALVVLELGLADPMLFVWGVAAGRQVAGLRCNLPVAKTL